MFLKMFVLLSILSGSAFLLWLLNLITLHSETDVVVLVVIVLLGSVLSAVFTEDRKEVSS